VIDSAVGPLVAAGNFDAVTHLATPLAVRLTGELFGLTVDFTTAAAIHTTILGRAFTALRLSEEDRLQADAAVWAARRLFAALEAGTDADFESSETSHGEPDAFVDNLVFLYYTAAQMLAETVATCCAVLPQHPDQLKRLRRDPDLAERAVHEILRFDSPTQGTARLVTAPLEVGGRTLRPGRVLFLLLGSANRDERVFADPDRLDIGRPDNPHLGFGGGPYRCLGEAVAVAVGAEVLRSLLRHTDDLVATAPPRRLPASTFCRSYASAPLAACPAPASGAASAASPEGTQ
jgi:cytochrome P450